MILRKRVKDNKDSTLKLRNLHNRIGPIPVYGFCFVLLSVGGFSTFAREVAKEVVPSEIGSKWDHLSRNKHRVSGEWRVRVRGRHFAEKQNSFSGTEFSLLSSMKYQVVPSLNFKLNSKVGFKNDHVQLEYRDEYSDGNFKIYEAVAEFNPWSGASFKAGAINQSPYSSPIFVYGRSLPGVAEKIEYGVGNWTVIAHAQQTLATSKSFSAERSEAEETPIFNRETLGAELKLFRRWQVKAYASHFMFDYLASVTAADGAKLGHFTLGSGSAAQFRYKFAGFTTQTEIGYVEPNGVQVSAGGFWLKNQKAKVDGQGQSLYLQSSFPIAAYKLSLSYINFFKEREAAPAVFSSLSLGGNNRIGNSWSIDFSFEDLGFKIVGQLLDMDVIKESEGGRRGNAHSYYFGVETLSVKF